MSVITIMFDATHFYWLKEGVTLSKRQMMLIFLAGFAIGLYIPEILGWLVAALALALLLWKGKKILCRLLQICYYCFIKKCSCFYKA